MNRYGRVVLFLGAPGSGKGTQSTQLAAKLGIPSLSTGEMLRQEARQETAAGMALQQLLATGSLVGDEVVCAAVEARVKSAARSGGLVLDGFPRTVPQAKMLDRLLGRLGMGAPLVLHLDVAREELMKRLTARRQCPECGAIYHLIAKPSAAGEFCELDGEKLVQRADDNETSIRRRLVEYETATAPLIQYYGRRAEYYRVDGARDARVIAAELEAISQRVPAYAAA